MSEAGPKSVQVKVCNDLLMFSEKGRIMAGYEKWLDKRVLFLYRVAAYVEDRTLVVEMITQDLNVERKLFNDNFVYKLIQPVVLVCVGLLGVTALYGGGVPMVQKLFKVENPYEYMPVAVKYVGEAVSNFGIVFVFILFCLRIAFVKARDNWVGARRDQLSKHFPLILYRSFQSAKLLKVISLLRLSDMSLIDALRKLDGWVDPYLRWHVRRMIKGLSHGKSKESYFGNDLLSDKQLIRLRVQTGQTKDSFSDGLMFIAKKSDLDAASIMKKYAKRVQIVLYAIGGALGMLFLKGAAALMMMIDT